MVSESLNSFYIHFVFEGVSYQLSLSCLWQQRSLASSSDLDFFVRLTSTGCALFNCRTSLEGLRINDRTLALPLAISLALALASTHHSIPLPPLPAYANSKVSRQPRNAPPHPRQQTRFTKCERQQRVGETLGSRRASFAHLPIRLFWHAL
jgi:hypothetical protein